MFAPRVHLRFLHYQIELFLVEGEKLKNCLVDILKISFDLVKKMLDRLQRDGNLIHWYTYANHSLITKITREPCVPAC